MSGCFVGVMTGNSLDGADAALLRVEADGTPRLLEAARVAMPAALAAAVRGLADGGAVTAGAVLTAQNEVTDVCVRAVAALGAAAEEVTAVGCHGQTIAHLPAAGASWQLLNGARLAERTGMDVVCDFRARDVASGGQGAPLAPFFHQRVFAEFAPCAVVNVGGIANVTRLDAAGEIVAAYDTGPGMLLMDAWCRRQGRGEFDRDGAMAAEGRVCEEGLARLLRHAYFGRAAPKSCGREEFCLAWGLEAMRAGGEADVQATLLELTARTIAAEVRGETVFLCGGGSANAVLRRRVGELAGGEVRLSDEVGVPAQAMEAAAFAWLAQRHWVRAPLAAAAVTGGGTRVCGAHYPR